MRAVVMTLIGEDRPGLVESVSTIVTDHGGNWLESRMSRLGGQFAGIVQVEVATEKEQALVDALKRLATRGLNVVIHAEPKQPAASRKPASLLEIIGQDRPGIVSQISHALASFGVNVEELHTECTSAAMTGESLFKARAKLSIPESCNIATLRQQLEKIAADLIVDISLEPVS